MIDSVSNPVGKEVVQTALSKVCLSCRLTELCALVEVHDRWSGWLAFIEMRLPLSPSLSLSPFSWQMFGPLQHCSITFFACDDYRARAQNVGHDAEKNWAEAKQSLVLPSTQVLLSLVQISWAWARYRMHTWVRIRVFQLSAGPFWWGNLLVLLQHLLSDKFDLPILPLLWGSGFRSWLWCSNL